MKQMMRLIDMRDSVTKSPPVEVLYCYGAWQKGFSRDNVTFIEGMLDPETDIPNDGLHRWLVVDDLMEEVMAKGLLNSLYTKYSHKNVTVFFIVQNLFAKNMRTVSLNTQYFFLFKNPRDKQTIDNLAKQAFPGRVEAVREAYAKATSAPYSCLLWNMRQETDDRYRLVGSCPCTCMTLPSHKSIDAVLIVTYNLGQSDDVHVHYENQSTPAQ